MFEPKTVGTYCLRMKCLRKANIRVTKAKNVKWTCYCKNINTLHVHQFDKRPWLKPAVEV